MALSDNGRSVTSVAKDLGISEQTIYRWLDQHKARQNPDKVRIMELEAELKAANRRVADLEEIFATQPRK